MLISIIIWLFEFVVVMLIEGFGGLICVGLELLKVGMFLKVVVKICVFEFLV